jgi:hypothetical protein
MHASKLHCVNPFITSCHARRDAPKAPLHVASCVPFSSQHGGSWLPSPSPADIASLPILRTAWSGTYQLLACAPTHMIVPNADPVYKNIPGVYRHDSKAPKWHTLHHQNKSLAVSKFISHRVGFIGPTRHHDRLVRLQVKAAHFHALLPKSLVQLAPCLLCLCVLRPQLGAF